MATATLRRLLIFTALVGALALPVAAQAVPGDGEVNELYVHPSTTQAGGHPDVHLFFRFCSAIPHVTNATNSTPIVITTAEPHGLVTGDTIAVRGIAGNLAANTPQGKATVLSPNSFELRDANNNPVTGNDTYGGGNWISKAFYHDYETQ